GALHEETNYGAKEYIEKKKVFRYLRKPLALLPAKNVDNIVDPQIRRIVSEKLYEVGGDPKKFDGNWPVLRVYKNGKTRVIPIKTVRIRVSANTQKIGRTGHERHVLTGANHHMEVYAILDNFGNEVKWKAEVVTLLDAYSRVREKKPVVCRDFGPKTRFKFSLSIGEAISMNDGSDQMKIYVIRKMAKESGQLFYKLHNDARLAGEIGTEGLSSTPGGFQKKGFVKLYIDVLGNVFPAND
ncbi:MAG: hypothetical protein J6X44_09745, partial [Thermoguttaceae bacterium]|nr:hypothetical protein [Thermoguttaceae bacterium]